MMKSSILSIYKSQKIDVFVLRNLGLERGEVLLVCVFVIRFVLRAKYTHPEIVNYSGQ
jgi:hypothetical protein